VQLTCYPDRFTLDLYYPGSSRYARFAGAKLLDVLRQASEYVIKEGDPVYVAEQLESYFANCEESR
jgi:hypothetical protein